MKSDPGLDSSDEEPFIMIPKGSRKGHDLVIDDMGHRMTYKGLSVLVRLNITYCFAVIL